MVTVPEFSGLIYEPGRKTLDLPRRKRRERGNMITTYKSLGTMFTGTVLTSQIRLQKKQLAKKKKNNVKRDVRKYFPNNINRLVEQAKM